MIAHIGYHKTGTTFLQHNVFPNIEGINFYNVNIEKNSFFKEKICWSPTLEFDKVEVMKELDISDNTLYSFENFVGFMGKGTYNYEIAHRLKEIGFKKIIVAIRRQDKMMESLYRQHVQSGGTLKPNEYLKDVRYFRWSFLDYYPLIKLYIELFGRENVLILMQEELKESSENVARKIVEFCGAEGVEMKPANSQTNTSLSVLAIRLLRVVNHFTYSNLRPSNLISKSISTWKTRTLLKYLDPYSISLISFKKSFYSDSFQNETLKKFEGSNKKIEKEFGVNISNYGYLENDISSI